MIDRELLVRKFEVALPYGAYVATAKPEHLENWRRFEARAGLTEAQRALVASFTRGVNALCVSGTWCGDCVQQLPFLKSMEDANPRLFRVRFLDRDEHRDLAGLLHMGDGMRVPVAILMNEEFDFVTAVGDRTLSRYRALAARQLGGACPLPGAPLDEDEVAATRQDWVDAVERVHLMCRLSTKLRQKHGD